MARAAASLFLSAACLTAQSLGWQQAIERAARHDPTARIEVLEIATGRVLASHRLNEAMRTLSAPGSTLKPLVLYSLVAAGRWSPERRVVCDRQLTIAGHRLACSHPAGPPFNAREALTWSCNSYFAEVARTLRPGELSRILSPSGLLDATGPSHDEAVAEYREPRNVEEMQLAVLGVKYVRVTPLELASAYRWLALEMVAHRGSEATELVRAGLEDSASFGMAGGASQSRVTVMGKTGTAEGAGSSQTHGWFAGMSPVANPKVVIVVYLPTGRGADAARIAGKLLALAPAEKP